MPLSTIVIDDAAKDAKQIRAFALAGEFRDIEYDGHTYKNINPDVPAALMSQRLSEALGKPTEISMQFFRYTRERDEPTSWIHADTGCAEYAALWYLTPQELCAPGNGTAFWRNRALDTSVLPTAEEFAARGYTPETASQLLLSQADDEFAWQKEAIIGMKWNRLVIYPTKVFHSPYPRHGFGHLPEDSRLIWVGFFNVVS